jgi:hypothetical protein
VKTEQPRLKTEDDWHAKSERQHANCARGTTHDNHKAINEKLWKLRNTHNASASASQTVEINSLIVIEIKQSQLLALYSVHG